MILEHGFEPTAGGTENGIELVEMKHGDTDII